MSLMSYSPPGIVSKAHSYYAFRGMDRSRDIGALERPEGQSFWLLRNCHIDDHGQLVRDPAVFPHAQGLRRRVNALRFYTPENVVFAEEDFAVHLTDDRGATLDSAYPAGTVLSMTNFLGSTYIFAQDRPIHVFDGFRFAFSPASISPAFGVPVQRRLAVAGFSGRPTVVEFSRVDNPDVFLEEDQATAEVTRAAFIDIGNLIGTADTITGLGSFEANRLAVFTRDQALVYRIEPDFEKWALDSRANLRVGCISHNTIANAGGDLLFCSRRGIHSIMRSEVNGITIAEASLSNEISDYYRDLVQETPNLAAVSAFFDQDEQTYHVFFPRKDANRVTRLSMRFQSGYEAVNFQVADSVHFRCGDSLGGRVMYGALDGVYEESDRVAAAQAGVDEYRRGEMVAETPILWLSDFMSTKRAHTFILQASGRGRLLVDILDEIDREMQTIDVELDHLEDSPRWPRESISRSFAFPFSHTFRGLRLRFRTEERDVATDVRVTSFAFLIHKEK